MQNEDSVASRVRPQSRRSTVVLVGVLSALLALLFPTLVIAVFEAFCGILCVLQHGTFRRAYVAAGVALFALSAVQFTLFFTDIQLSFGWTLFST